MTFTVRDGHRLAVDSSIADNRLACGRNFALASNEAPCNRSHVDYFVHYFVAANNSGHCFLVQFFNDGQVFDRKSSHGNSPSGLNMAWVRFALSAVCESFGSRLHHCNDHARCEAQSEKAFQTIEKY
jgi:hypothetical protein